MRGGLALLLAGGAIGAAITALILNNERESEYAAGQIGVDRAAAKTFGWGLRQRAEGNMVNAAGAVKEGLGRFTGDPDLENEGTVDRVTGKVQDTLGKVGTAAAQTLHDLNR
jgi:uncharacterized protein YjbJ (UPF0337 family)